MVEVRAASHPLKVGRVDMAVPAGLTVAEILEVTQPDPILRAHAHVFIGDQLVPRDYWSRARPKEGALISIRAFIPPTGGGGGGNNKVLRTVLMLVVVAAAFAAPYLLGLAGVIWTIAGVAVSASSLTTALIGAAGMLLVNAIAPIRPPKMPQLSGSGAGTRSSPTLFIEGSRNSARPFDVVPVVLGKHRHTPPYGARPYTETVGDQNYLRLLFVHGVGPLQLSEHKIGETLITEFDDVQIEHREGQDSDDPLTLFPDVVDQENISIALTNTASWQTRTASPNADELSVDLTWPNGFVRYNSKGERSGIDVQLEFAYKETTSGTWLPIPTEDGARTFPDAWIDDLDTNSDFTLVTFSSNRDSAVRHGLTWKVPTRGQYDIRIRRVTADDTSTPNSTDTTAVFWTALRRITNEDPLNSPVPLAKTAIRIKATDQLNSVIDEYNCIAESKVTSYDPTSPASWVADQTSRNPADLFRHVLQTDALQSPLADARLDLDNLAEWWQFCDDAGFEFNMVRDFQSSVWEVLADVAAAGRASPTQIDGKWGVVFDQAQSVPVSHVSPRNSKDFVAEKAFVDRPHAFRVRFPNEDQGYRQDERIVYLDGYTSANATKFEALELPGVTDPDQIWKLGRYHAAVLVNRPERWTFRQELEHVVYKRGDLILLTHDVLLVGLASGRVKSVDVDTNGDVTAITVDEACTMSAGADYGVSIRTPSDAKVTRQVVTEAGDQTTLTLSTVIAAADAPSEGDLFAFGLLGSETEDALVLSIEPSADFEASVSVVPYRSTVYDADSGTIPAFTTNITPLLAVPIPDVEEIRSDESMLKRGPGQSLQVRVAIRVAMPEIEDFAQYNPVLDVQQRTGTEPYFNSDVEVRTPDELVLAGFQTGETWQFRLRWRLEGRLPGTWAETSPHQVVGRSGPPNPLSNLTISAFGGQALMRWDPPVELDVIFGGEVRFRHQEVFSGTTWAQSMSIGEVARAYDLVASLPLKPGTYLARVYDLDGNPSETVSSVTTKQASVLTYANVDTVDEAPTFAGVHDGTWVNSDDELTLDASTSTLFDAVTDVDAMGNFDYGTGGVGTSGTYDFAAALDLTTVQKVRLTTRISAVISNVNDLIDERTDNIDDWEDFDGTLAAGADCKIYVRHTDDDPAVSGASWSAYERLDSAEFEARGFEFQARLSSEDSSYNVEIRELGIDVEDVT